MSNNSNTFETSDIGIAAYVMMRGLVLKDANINKTISNGNNQYFFLSFKKE